LVELFAAGLELKLAYSQKIPVGGISRAKIFRFCDTLKGFIKAIPPWLIFIGDESVIGIVKVHNAVVHDGTTVIVASFGQ
jgi:hypothetical protein